MKKKRARVRKNRNFKAVKQRIARTLIIIGVITTASVITIGVWKLRDVFEPISTHASNEVIYSFSPEQNTVIFAYKNTQSEITQIHIVGLNTTERTINELVIPGNTLAVLPLGLDEYQLKHIFKVVQMSETENLTGEQISILQQALQNITGTISDQIVILSDNKPPSSVVDQLINPLTIANLALNNDWVKNHMVTSLSKSDVLQYIWNLTKTKPYKHTVVNINNENYSEKIVLKDGTETVKVNQINTDALNKQLFEKVDLAKERIPIKITNTTQTSGLAAHVERLFSNVGGYIIETDSSTESLKKTKIILHTQSTEESYTLALLKSMLHIPVEVMVDEQNYHYALTVELGEDFADFMRGEESQP